MTTPIFYRTYLREELARRCDVNPRYSLRAFARALEMDAGAFSRILTGKRPLSLKGGLRLTRRLALTPGERTRFLDSIAEEQKLRGALPAELGADDAPTLIDIEYFRVIADWYHYALLELTFTRGFRADSSWIARALGISRIEATLAIDRLLKLGLLKRVGRRLEKAQPTITTKDKHRTSAYLRQHQRQMLGKALHSLDNDPIEERSMTGMTMAIDPGRLGLARQMIETFTDELRRTLENGRQKRVYQLSIGLFPLQTKESIE